MLAYLRLESVRLSGELQTTTTTTTLIFLFLVSMSTIIKYNVKHNVSMFNILNNILVTLSLKYNITII